MTKEEAISIMKVIVHMLEEKYDTDRVEEAVDMAISALSEKDWKFYYDHGYAQAKRDLSENKGDLISRETVLKIIDGWYEQNRDTDNIEDLIVLITYMDSVNPQKPKIGHWILMRTFPTKLYDEYLKEYECSECYRRIRCTESQLVNYPYCHCSAKMLEVEE